MKDMTAISNHEDAKMHQSDSKPTSIFQSNLKFQPETKSSKSPTKTIHPSKKHPELEYVTPIEEDEEDESSLNEESEPQERKRKGQK